MIARQPPSITVRTTIGDDHRLSIDIPLPPDMPTGQVEVELVLHPTTSSLGEAVNHTLEAAREKMRSKGRLSRWHTGETTAAMDDEALWGLVQLSPEAPPSEQLINEERGLY
ncbi:MAG: hypothetical protein LCI00_16270 [Chloroflexi bacterium]|nr:hypothetical protein [Chloroflexota bacterium]MCC6892788.1 hypothetical protein [Anaerolineae bacterium]